MNLLGQEGSLRPSPGVWWACRRSQAQAASAGGRAAQRHGRHGDEAPFILLQRIAEMAYCVMLLYLTPDACWNVTLM